MATIDIEKEKKNYEQLMESLNLQEKKEDLHLDKGCLKIPGISECP